MIGRLKGTLLEKHPPEILLDVNGVGYELLLPMTCFYNLPEINQEVTLFTHLTIREDAHLLFGFLHKQERSLFRELIKTNGVGPKLALAILSAMSVNQFISAVEQEDLSKLVKIPGVGKKTGERLVVELKSKFKATASIAIDGNNFDLQTIAADNINSYIAVKDEAISALISLGYKPNDASRIINQINRDDYTSEQLIREALKNSL